MESGDWQLKKIIMKQNEAILVALQQLNAAMAEIQQKHFEQIDERASDHNLMKQILLQQQNVKKRALANVHVKLCQPPHASDLACPQ